MKGRNMFYGNYQAGGVIDQNYINPPSGYNVNSSYQAFGPNMNPNMNFDNDYENRISNLEKQIRSLNQRVERLESLKESSVNNDSYMI